MEGWWLQRRNGNLLKCLLCVSNNAYPPHTLNSPIYQLSLSLSLFIQLSLSNSTPKFPQVYHASLSLLSRRTRAPVFVHPGCGKLTRSNLTRHGPSFISESSIGGFVGWISRKSPRASGPMWRRCLPPTRRVLLNHGQPRKEKGTNKGLLYLHRSFGRWLWHVCTLWETLVLIHTDKSVWSSNLIFVS